VAANILIMRAFVDLRRTHHDLLELRRHIENLVQRVDGHDALLAQVLAALDALSLPATETSRPIGFRPS
jgi:hypothetical protein